MSLPQLRIPALDPIYVFLFPVSYSLPSLSVFPPAASLSPLLPLSLSLSSLLYSLSLSPVSSTSSLICLPTQIVIYVQATPEIDSTWLSATLSVDSRCCCCRSYLNLACNQLPNKWHLSSAFNSSLLLEGRQQHNKIYSQQFVWLAYCFKFPHIPEIGPHDCVDICLSPLPACAVCLSCLPTPAVWQLYLIFAQIKYCIVDYNIVNFCIC